MSRTILALVAGLLIGAAGFHAYYLRLDPLSRCRLDNPFDDRALLQCREKAGGEAARYSPADREQLDDLVDRVAPE